MQNPEEGCEEEDSKKKWMCEYCTYSNWQSSTKCTMCRGNKPVILCSSENIYSAANTNTLRGEIDQDLVTSCPHNLLEMKARLNQLCRYSYFWTEEKI